MSKDVMILALLWFIAFTVVTFFVPRTRWAEAIFIFLISNSFTWINALIHLELGLISFPVRLFPKATDLSISLDYFLFPILFVLYILYEPKENWRIRILYLVLWVSGIVILDILLDRSTNLIKFIHYTWYWAWLDICILFISVRMFYAWYFRRGADVT